MEEQGFLLNILMLTIEKDMHEYQKYAIITAIKRRYTAIFLGTGLGKTIISLTITDQLLKRKLIRSTLVVCTKKAMFNSWRQEAKLWEYTRYLNFSILHGSAGKGNSEYVKRKNLLSPDTHIYLINYEGLPWLARTLNTLYRNRKMPFDCVFYDESTKIKHSTTQRFIKFKPHMKRFTYRYPMTGTPIPNGLMDLYGQMYVCDLGYSLGSTLTSYRERFFISIPQDTHKIYTLRRGSKKAISRRIKDRVIHMRKQDYVKLPPIIYNKMKIDLPKKLRNQYEELETKFFIELEQAKVEAFSKATLSMKLRQFLQGKMYSGLGADRKIISIHDEKLQVVKEMVDLKQKKTRILEGIGNCIIAYNFQYERTDLQSIFPGAPAIDGSTTDAQDTENIKRWNLKQIPILLYNPASDPHGLNLQLGGNQILWYSLTWNLEQYLQLIDRLYRQRQEKTVFVHHIIFRDTIDEVICAALGTKEATQNSLLKTLKTYRKEKTK